MQKGTCDYNFKEGWWCSAEKGHDGPCPLRQEVTYSYSNSKLLGNDCNICGAVVRNRSLTLHTEWHDNGAH